MGRVEQVEGILPDVRNLLREVGGESSAWRGGLGRTRVVTRVEDLRKAGKLVLKIPVKGLSSHVA